MSCPSCPSANWLCCPSRRPLSWLSTYPLLRDHGKVLIFMMFCHIRFCHILSPSFNAQTSFTFSRPILLFSTILSLVPILHLFAPFVIYFSFLDFRSRSSSPRRAAPAPARAPPPRQAPAPAPAARSTPPAPAPAQQQGGGMLSGLGQTMMQGFAFGTGR